MLIYLHLNFIVATKNRHRAKSANINEIALWSQFQIFTFCTTIQSLASIHLCSDVLACLGYGWNATPKTAQPNTLLINNIVFNMVNNSKNALCIFCCDADRCHTVNARVLCSMAIVVRMEGDMRQTIERIIIYLIWCGVVYSTSKQWCVPCSRNMRNTKGNNRNKKTTDQKDQDKMGKTCK